MTKNKKNGMSPKKAFYIALTVILGALLGFIAYGLLSIRCAEKGLFPTYLFWPLLLAGAVSGFFLGFRWWRMVYIEHRHWRDWCKNGKMKHTS